MTRPGKQLCQHESNFLKFRYHEEPDQLRICSITPNFTSYQTIPNLLGFPVAMVGCEQTTPRATVTAAPEGPRNRLASRDKLRTGVQRIR